MSAAVYLTKPAPVKESSETLIPPQPGEFVASLVERGLAADALAVQRQQYADGARRARRGLPAGDYLPVATWKGYCDALADMLTASEPVQ